MEYFLFWGIFKYDPENKDNDGLSLAIAHNDKALKAIEGIKSQCVIQELPLSAIDYIHNAPQGKNEMKEQNDLMMQSVKLNGYMPTVMKSFKKQVQKAIVKDRMRKILRITGLWRIIKK